MQSGTFEKYGRIAKAVGELKNARKISVRFLIVGIIHSVNIFLCYGIIFLFKFFNMPNNELLDFFCGRTAVLFCNIFKFVNIIRI